MIFLGDLMRRRLASLLQPWLRNEPDLELKLGFFSSHGTAKGLVFDTSALNGLLDESSSWSFEDVRIEELSARVSLWSVSALVIEVRGFHVTVSARKSNQETSTENTHEVLESSLVMEKKKILDVIDPQGSSLHDVLARLSDTGSSRNQRSSFLNLILEYSQLKIHDIHLGILYPLSSDSLGLLWDIKSLNLFSSSTKRGCFLGGLSKSLFIPLNESSFCLDLRGSAIRLKSRDTISSVLSCKDLLTSIRLKDSQFTDMHINVPELDISVSPVNLPMILNCYKLSSKEPSDARNGRKLWNIVARKIRYLVPATGISLQKLVGTVHFWLQYVKTYENLLTNLGYPMEEAMTRSVVLISQNDLLSELVRNQWKTISEIEKKLPVEAIVQGRKISCYRAALRSQQSRGLSEESHSNSPLRKFRKILSKITKIIWNVLSIIFNSLMYFISLVFVHNSRESDVQPGVVSLHSYTSCLNMRKILVHISTCMEPQTFVTGNKVSDNGIPSSDFCVTLSEFYLAYTESLCKWCLSFSCGDLQITSSKPTGQGSRNIRTDSKRANKNEIDDFKTILWSEPAMVLDFAQHSSTSDDGENPTISLWRILAEMMSNWKRCCSNVEGSITHYEQDPWVTCEIKNSVTDLSLMSVRCGFWKCSLMMGKLNLILGYASLLSMALLLQQMQHAFCLTNNNDRKKYAPVIPVTHRFSSDITWDMKVKSYTSGLKLKLLHMLPEKHIQLAVFIVGPHLHISLRKDGIHDGNASSDHIVAKEEDLDLDFDVHDFELGALPTLDSKIVRSIKFQGLNGVESKCWRWKELSLTEIPLTDNDTHICLGQILLEAYVKFNGVSVYLDSSTANPRNRIIVLNPMSIQLSSLRKEFHPSNIAVNILKSELRGTFEGVSVLLCIDELYVLFKVMAHLFSAVLDTHYSFASLEEANHGHVNQEFVSDDSVNYETSTIWGRGLSFYLERSRLFLDIKFVLQSSTLILCSSKKRSDAKTSVFTFDAERSKKLSIYGVPDHGILTSVRQISLQLFCEEQDVKFHSDLNELQSLIFIDQSKIGSAADAHELGKILDSLNCLYEAYLPHFAFSLELSYLPNDICSSSGNAVNGASSSREISCLDIPSRLNGESLSLQGSLLEHKVDFGPATDTPDSGHWIVIDLAVGNIYVTDFTIKRLLVGIENSDNLKLSITIGREFQITSCKAQGGFVMFEPAALATFSHCVASYNLCITDTCHLVTFSEERTIDETRDDMVKLNDYPKQATESAFWKMTWNKLEALVVDFSGFSLALLFVNESGQVQELKCDVDFHFNLKRENTNQKLLAELSRFSVLSKLLLQVDEQINKVQIPHFSLPQSSNYLYQAMDVEPNAVYQHRDGIKSVDDENHSSMPVSQEKSYGDSLPSGVHLSQQNCILKKLHASLFVERSMSNGGIDFHCLSQAWSGTGSIEGFDITVSLRELDMLLSAIQTLSGISGEEASQKGEERLISEHQERERVSPEEVPDGAIVAIQDVHQHMYISVEITENKYKLAGSLHYSLVGERALFRVKYTNRKWWNSSVLWFSLVSLYAKNDLGEPLRLNYHPGSGFVQISCSNDSAQALWRVLSCKSESSETESGPDSYDFAEQNTFFLVNKKSGFRVAFVDRLPEFVSKPGNPFKWKVLDNLSLSRNVGLPHNFSRDVSGSCAPQNLLSNVEIAPEVTGNLTCIDITLAKINITLIHELPDTDTKFPLLQGSVTVSDFIIQVLLDKLRIISTFSFALLFFDAQSNLWREFVLPAEVCVFYRSMLHVPATISSHKGTDFQFYMRLKALGISITELSLDILLFVIGKLKLSGPYSIKTSMVFSNCCKVENQSGSEVLCHFSDNQDLLIPRKQAGTIFLRHLSLEDPTPKASYITIQLAEHGVYSTTPIRVPLLEAKTLAWRTRIISSQDSRSYPGPFLVVDISRKIKDGLSITITPLLRFYNETKYSMELRFRRPEENVAESVFATLKMGEMIDDSVAAFDAINLSGGLKKALMSLSVGNFLLSFRPKVMDGSIISERPLSEEWSDDLKGGKAVRISGLLDKLSYKVRKAFLVEDVKVFFSTTFCSLKYENGRSVDLHFLIRTIVRNVPVIKPDVYSYGPGSSNSPVALQEQREIFLLPTIKVSNLLDIEVHVLLSNTDPCASSGCDNIGNQTNIPYGSTVDLYVDLATIYFVITLTAFNSSCKPVSGGDWAKKLQKQKDDLNYLDIDLDFSCGKYFASLRLARGERGTLEAAIWTKYMLKNDTELPLLCCAQNQRPISMEKLLEPGFQLAPELGYFLLPKSTRSWLMKCNKVRLKLLKEKSSEVLLNLDSLSGLAELGLGVEERFGVKRIAKLGVSLGPANGEMNVPSQVIYLVPRYVIFNESKEVITVRQFHLQDEMGGTISINSKQKIALEFFSETSEQKEMTVLEKFLLRHRNDHDDSLVFIQFRLSQDELSWSGPICVSSIGRFFLKFRRSVNSTNDKVTTHDKSAEFASVHVVEEGSTLALHFHKSTDINLPYRIENGLRGACITYYQKGLSESDILGSGNSINYVWDNLTLPRTLVVQINGMHILREINLDKVRSWKQFYRFGQQRGLGLQWPLDRSPREQEGMTSRNGKNDVQMVNVGYEVYTDGLTRVLRICEFPDSHKGDSVFSSGKLRLRISSLDAHLLEHAKQEVDVTEPFSYTPLMVMRLGNISFDYLLTGKSKYNRIRVQSLSLDQKRIGAPYAAILRRHQFDHYDFNVNMIQIVVILLSSNSNAKLIKYASIVLQPLDLNLDEETLLRLVPFWRKSLDNSPSQPYYFDHFEIHPIKIIANFIPGDSSYSSYSSTQETLRSLVHSVIKIPAIKKMPVELNGVSVSHALLTTKELIIKCAQHYSWYAMRAVYIAKGSPLLPPAFASIFDDSASSSLDIFFDPSSGSISLPGLTIGTFKLVSKCLDGKGFTGTKRYLGDLGKTMKMAGSNILFSAVTEISDSVLKGAEANGFNGLLSGFRHGILKLAMEPSVLGSALLIEGGPDRKVKLDRSPGVDELYIEGYLQAMLDALYIQDYIRVRVIDDQVMLKNLPPNSSLIEEIMNRVKSFLISKALLKGDTYAASRPLHHQRGDSEWKFGPTILTLCEHLFVSFAIRALRKQTGNVVTRIKTLKPKIERGNGKAVSSTGKQKVAFVWKWGIGKFVLSGIVAYIDGRLCRSIPNPLARRIVSGFVLSFLDKDDNNE
ncbi:LOW QUALITY PROTEIN: uncharacterized protein LOC124916644 [Impatiens glandulifera]|uniref:LOW QUALITY PROTEIN: uncharacterized protein LOC124916644 n=1 Tax=Impatiens glandulifera TaxID=253017 RepID=UPI001FB0EEE7|nr:LOW QUALITY PROTEIN: uncharacterized protein LOC124916644 [Impatiens glandulifera]